MKLPTEQSTMLLSRPMQLGASIRAQTLKPALEESYLHPVPACSCIDLPFSQGPPDATGAYTHHGMVVIKEDTKGLGSS